MYQINFLYMNIRIYRNERKDIKEKWEEIVRFGINKMEQAKEIEKLKKYIELISEKLFKIYTIFNDYADHYTEKLDINHEKWYTINGEF